MHQNKKTREHLEKKAPAARVQGSVSPKLGKIEIAGLRLRKPAGGAWGVGSPPRLINFMSLRGKRHLPGDGHTRSSHMIQKHEESI